MADRLSSTTSKSLRGDTKHKPATKLTSPVDGRWAVVVVIASFIGRAIVAMQSSSMPILTVEWEKKLGATPSEISWATTLVTSPRFLIAPVAGALNRRFGCRPIVFLGGVMAMISISVLSWTCELWQIFVCCSVIGTSVGLVYQGTVIVVNLYFDKWLGRANGLAYSGVGVGIMVGSPLVALLIDYYTWRGALIIVAAITLNVSVAAAVYRPLSWWKDRKIDPKRNSDHYPLSVRPRAGKGRRVSDVNLSNNADPHRVVRYDAEDIDIYPDMLPNNCCPTESIANSSCGHPSQEKFNPETKCCNVIKQLLDLFGFNLLWTNSNVLLLCFVSIFQGAAYFTSYVYLPSYIVSSGVTELKASFILTILGTCSLVGRLTHGFLIDFRLISPTNLYGVASVVAGCSGFFIVVSESYPAFVAYSVVFGLSTGAKIPLCPVMTKKYTAPSQLANAFALLSLFTGLSQLFGTYMLGLLFDWTSNYKSCFCLIAVLFCVDGVLAFLIEPWNRYRHRSLR